MILTKRANGKYYIVYIKPNGKRTGISTRTKIKSEALKFLSQFERELEQRKLQKLTPITLQEFNQRFLDYSKTVHTPKTHKAYSLTHSFVEKFFGEVSLTEITPSRMNDYFEQRIKNSSIYQARKDLICLNSLFNKAISEGYLLQNPCKVIKRFRLPEKQPLFFSELELETLLNKVKEKDVRDLLVFAMQTGLRQMELLTLEWSQINFKDRYLTLTNQSHITKSKKVRMIPLSIKAMQIIVERELTKASELVFTLNRKAINPNYISQKFKSYVREAAINDNLTFHSLRHTFASWLVQRGVSILQVSKLLGHCSVKVTQIYSHLRSEDLQNAINVLNN